MINICQVEILTSKIYKSDLTHYWSIIINLTEFFNKVFPCLLSSFSLHYVNFMIFWLQVNFLLQARSMCGMRLSASMQCEETNETEWKKAEWLNEAIKVAWFLAIFRLFPSQTIVFRSRSFCTIPLPLPWLLRLPSTFSLTMASNRLQVVHIPAI